MSYIDKEKLNTMNKYTFTFPFKGDYHYVHMTANQLANGILNSSDDILEFIWDNEGQGFEQRIHVDGKEYDVTFAHNNTKCFNVYNVEDDLGSGHIVERDIPWLLLKVEQGDKEIYNLADNL